MIFVRGGSYSHFGENYDQDIFSLADEVIQSLIKQGMNLNLVEAVVVGNMFSQLLDYQSQLASVISHRWGLTVPSLRVESACASGGLAVWTGINLIKAGYKNVLVIGLEKMTDYPTTEITKMLATAGYSYSDVPFQISFPATYALYANYWLKNHWLDGKTLYHIAAKNHYYGSLNPQAQFQSLLSEEVYLNSNLVAYPLRLFDCSPISDGAAALWLSSQRSSNSIELIGAEFVTGPNTPYLNSPLDGLPAAKKAAKLVYSQAGIEPKDIDLAEVHDCFTIAEAMALVDLGLVAKEQLIDYYRFYHHHHRPPTRFPAVNTSGGLKAAGHPIGATGVKQVVEIYLQLSRQAGRRQLDKARIGLTHNVGGSGGSVFVSLWKKGGINYE